jgi:hypothetical protein
MNIPNNLMNEILNYLARQPYREVAHMINGIGRVQAQEQEGQEELPLDEN